MRKLFSFIVLSALTTSGFAKGDAKLGKTKAITCAACHGQNGISLIPTYPNLACQKSAYLVKQMKDFKSGKRKDPIMAPLVKALSDKDFENIAAYYETLPSCAAFNKTK